MDIVKTYIKYGGLLEGHFLLSSGLHSDKYLQSEKVLQYPAVATDIISGLVNQLEKFKFSTVVSPAIGGIRFGYELARQMEKRAIFTERVDGSMKFRRGFALFKGEQVIVAEDVVTTGKSTKECIKAIEDAGGEVVAIVAIIDRSDGMADFKQSFLPLAKVDVKSYEAGDCPICKTGAELIKPGSRV